MTKLFLLLAAHCLCDYPLQGDFLARGKNHTAPLPGVPWYQCLWAHSMIHAGAVALITGSIWLGCAELAVRGTIYSHPNGVTADTDCGEFNDDEILGWQPLPAPPEPAQEPKK